MVFFGDVFHLSKQMPSLSNFMMDHQENIMV
jgi:hypothetical protein